MNDEDFDDFIANVDRSRGPTSCHTWQGKTYDSIGGYGHWRGELVHRVAWRLKNGAIPDGKVIMHKCDNPPCCNPAHLTIGTHADNRADCVRKGRHARGATHGSRKLSKQQITQIREKMRNVRHSIVAKKFGVSPALIRKIRRGQAYND